MAEIMRCEGLKKHFGSVRAVDGVDFGIEEGICFGLLGPNGAGKTTTVEIMEGVMSPSEGRILFHGTPIDRHFKQNVGIQFQSTALPEFITVRETLELFRAFYPNPRSIDELVELCALEDFLGRDNRKISGGQKQRMLLAIAIIPKPQIVFLDEPTTGLDPQARRHFWDLITRIKAENTTVVLTTHYMDEAELLCDRIAIMDHGKVLEHDTPQNLLDKHFGGVLLRIPRSAGKLPDEAPFNTAVEREDVYEIHVTNLEENLKRLIAAKLSLEGLAIHKPDLEDLFIKLTGSSLRA